MITANVPSAKKIIVHGPDSGSGGIPSQFPIHEDTIFQQLLTDSLEFFNIPENEVEYYFLVDTKTNLIPQRIFFLHDEFTHLPSFPRKSLEACFGMYNGPMGPELHAMDALHKFVWAQLMSDMFEKMENAFMFGDLHLFINVINGVMLMH
uniref:CRAL-TRIO domain-containing protein n=1 Tax=Ascaris lumbricoides TaxID=6252 RepID=A0A0M3IVV3_ASCLU